MWKLLKLINKYLGKEHETVRILEQSNLPSVKNDLAGPINKQKIFKQPISVTDRGFTSRLELSKETEEGMDVYTEEPIIIACCGRAIWESEIGGRCDVCGGYECKDHVFHCKSCSKCLCLKHTYFFEDPTTGTVVPYCLKHFKKAIFNCNTWQISDK